MKSDNSRFLGKSMFFDKNNDFSKKLWTCLFDPPFSCICPKFKNRSNQRMKVDGFEYLVGDSEEMKVDGQNQLIVDILNDKTSTV